MEVAFYEAKNEAEGKCERTSVEVLSRNTIE